MLRETQARLLADSRAAEPRARLAQVVSRADFLSRLTQGVSAIQRPERAIEALVAILLEDLVDVAAVSIRYGTWEFDCAETRGYRPTCQATQRTSPDESFSMLSAAGRVIDVDATGTDGEDVLGHWLNDSEVAARAAEARVSSLIALPLTARGRTFGVLLLGRRQGSGFPGATPFLRELAERVAQGLEGLLVLAESRHVATVLRDSLHPVRMPDFEGLDIATQMRVAHQSEAVGGDFIDGHDHGGEISLLIGDVAGKGVGAAVGARRITNAVRTLSEIDRDPSWVLDYANRVLCSEARHDSEWLATAALARLQRDDSGWVVDLAFAGHPPAIVVRRSGDVTQLAASGVALAVIPDSTYPGTTLRLSEGDLLVLHTDGVTEASGVSGLFGDDRLLALLAELVDAPAMAVAEAISVAVGEHLHGRPHDDIALLVVRIDSGADD